jgi:hypothetical protein
VFVRVKRGGTGTHAREYLLIVESRRDGGRVRQRVIATLGRRDPLVADGTLDQLLQSLARFSERLRVVCQRSPYSEPPGSGKLSHPGSPILSQAGSPMLSQAGAGIVSHLAGGDRTSWC